MCGIAGFIVNKNIKAESLDIMLNAIKHRGPDGSGRFVSKKVQLVHARLSLIDLENGGQPIEYNNLIIVFNGEIYNHKELRLTLISKGYSFITNSDTEVVVKLYHLFGYEFVKYLNGIYSICIYDKNNDELILARDYFGVKPFYVYDKGEYFVFASEFKAIIKFLKHNDIFYKFNNVALVEFLITGYISHNQLVENIYALPSGTVFSLKDGELNIRYKLDVNSLIGTKSDIENCIRKQVELELEADVEVGILLSGGIDSSLLTALSTRFGKNRIKTFSIGYKESEIYNESEYARIVANNFNTNHFEFFFTENDLLEQLPDLIDCMDMPIYDPAMLPMLFLSKNVKKEVKAVLSGDGGDELFGGYIQYRVFHYKRFLRLITFLKSIIGPFFRKVELLALLMNNIGLHRGPFFYQQDRLITKLNYPNYVFKNLKDLMKYDVQYELKNKLLVKTDLTSMYRGLEIRVPFLNLELYSLSLSLKSKNLVGLFRGKIMLRKILMKYLPKSIVNKPKKGFRVPVLEWVSSGSLGNQIQKDLETDLHIPDSIISRMQIDDMLQSRSLGKYTHELFSLYLLNAWIKKYK